MDDPTNPYLLPAKGQTATQLQAAEALVLLLAEGAPAVQWTIRPRGVLTGQFFGATDAERRRALAEWQRIIGAGPVKVSAELGPTQHLTVAGSYEGVTVTVTTIVSSHTCSSCGGVA